MKIIGQKTSLRFILPVCAGLLAVSFLAFAGLFSRNDGRDRDRTAVDLENPAPKSALARKADNAPSEQAPASYFSALEAVLAETDPARRRQLLAQWAESVDADQIGDMLEKTGPIPNQELKTEARAALLSRWSMCDLAGVVMWFCNQSGNDDLHQQALNLLGLELAGRASVAMVSWMEQSLPELGRKELYGPFFRQWAKTDPLAAAYAAAGQNDPKLFSAVAWTWAESDPRAAAAWISGLPAGETRNAATVSIAATWGEKNPMAAAAYASSLPQGNTHDTAVSVVVTAWATADPGRAAQWVGQFPESSLREQAMKCLISAWTSNNTAQAAQWLNSLPQSHSRDVAVNTFSGALIQKDPGTAFQWAEKISDETLRNQQLQSVASAWLAWDPAVAQQKISQSNLSQEIKNRLLSGSGQ